MNKKYNDKIDISMTIASLKSSTGGPARSVPRLGKALINAGADVQLYVNNNEVKSALLKKTAQVPFTINAINRLGETVQESKAKKPNSIIIHNHGIWLPLNHHATINAKRLKVPLIISPRGMLEPWARNYQRWKKKLAWLLYQHQDLKSASLIHATSTQEAITFHSLGFKIPIAVIPNGVDIPECTAYKIKQQRMKTVLFLSRIHPVKGLINLVRAWSRIRPVNWQMIIAGPDEDGHQNVVEREIHRHGLSNTFCFIGPVGDQEKWKLYNRSSLFVLPSHTENFGMVVAEALASGVPAITTKGTPWAELEEHKCGWWVDSGVEPLAIALEEAMALPQEARIAMGKRGLRLVEQKYSWEKIGEEMLSVYEWVLGRGTLPACVIKN